MADLESDLKVQNWLSILTFDAFKYANAGGEIAVVETEAGLVLTLYGVNLETEGINKKLRKLIAASHETP